MTHDLFSSISDPFSPVSIQEEEDNPSSLLEQPRKRSLGNDKDRLAMWREAGADALIELYKNDPLIRASLDAQLAQATQDKAQPKESNIVYDAQGNLLGVKSVGKAKNTDKGAAELMAAIRKDIANKYGIKA